MTEALTVPDLDTPEGRRIALRARWGELVPIILRAFDERDWEHFGYSDWASYVRDEIGAVALPTPERRDVVAALTAAGMSGAAIAETTGVTRQTVARDQAEATEATLPHIETAPSTTSRHEEEPEEPEPAEEEAPPAEVPDRVVGRDGRVYPKKRTAPQQVTPRQKESAGDYEGAVRVAERVVKVLHAVTNLKIEPVREARQFMVESTVIELQDRVVAAVTQLGELAAAVGVRIVPESADVGNDLELVSEDTNPTPFKVEAGMTTQAAMFGAICQAFGFDPASMLPGTRKKVGKVCGQLLDGKAQPSEIGPRAAEYKRKFRGAALTPTALLAHWDECVPEQLTETTAGIVTMILKGEA